MKEPIVTIAVALYNNECYIVRCLDSVLNQTYKNLDIIVVNDGSSDESVLICKEYINKNHQNNVVRLVSQENQGLSSARQKALELAVGDYICFIDADDFILPRHVENMLKKIIEDQSDVCICSTLFQDCNGVRLESETKSFTCINKDPIKVKLHNLCNVHYNYSGILLLSDSWNKLYSLHFLKETNVRFELPKGFNGSDLAYNHKLILYMPTFSFSPYATYVHVIYEKSAVHRKEKNLLGGFQIIISQLINECEKNKISNLMTRKLSGLYIYLIRYAFQDVFNENKCNRDRREKFKQLFKIDKEYRKYNSLISMKLRNCSTKSLLLFLFFYKYFPALLFVYFVMRQKYIR